MTVTSRSRLGQVSASSSTRSSSPAGADEMATLAQPLARHRTTSSSLARREAIEGLLYISPFLLGFLIFTAYPMIASFYLSFTKYNILNPPTWIGLENYQEAFFRDEQLW